MGNIGTPYDTVLEEFGEYFVQYCFRHGYDQLLRTLGKDFISFIQNLDTLHSYLARTYTQLRFPSFRCERRNAESVNLHYLTERTGLHPLVIGLAKAVSRDIYNQTAEMEVESISTHESDTGSEREHVVFIVQFKDLAENEKVVTKYDKQQLPSTSVLSVSHICTALPYHIVFDEDLQIKQYGNMISKLLQTYLPPNTCMTSIFSIMHPPMKFLVENIRMFSNSVFYLSLKKTDRTDNPLILRGEMMWLAEIKHMIYICSPRLTSLSELTKLNMYLSDIPLYDVTRELILLNQQRIAEIDIAKKLDETTAELKKTSRLLEEEKQRTDALLYQMLPQKVANDLKNGITIAAEKFEVVTILFSDIVTFTNIASECSPMEVVTMLNNLYAKFDEKTNEHDVYKVETIGDAYMIVNGCPEIKEIHVQAVANFAMDMVEEAAKVKSPATGLSLQIRVGFHSGPVVAGVVGVKMPRYCLFGDTVNTASRMESHGVPGRIHVSPLAYSLLINEDYIFRDRGRIEVKGKGLLNTYFLIGRHDDFMEEPADTYCSLPVIGKNGVEIEVIEEEELTKGHASGQDVTILVDDADTNEEKNNFSKKYGKTRTISETCTVL
ncbi:guanylate cyclase soluble subunit beta-2-like [Mytilus galloprovincialis]|uniref:guanylate cyclase soluble subunit beta-2-like n=1 Tax=Mytilus galloprovincialis TaxID=29158 RepID=UPI003F7CC0F9